MRVLIQRVTRACVTVGDEVVGQIGPGYVLLIGVTHTDSVADSHFLANKIAHIRILDDDTGNLNRSLLDYLADGRPAGLLVVSQFTLYADVRKGRRPSFTNASPPEIASPVIDAFVESLRSFGLCVEMGRFGAEMAVELVNDGPVTIWLDSADLRGQ